MIKILGIGVRRCAWCGKFLGPRWLGFGLGGTSHGICEPCRVAWERDAEKEAT